MTDSSSSVAKRPSIVGWKTFGHPGATRLLTKSFEANRLAHAYLITGPEKVGKRTLALDMACMVNTEPVADMFGQSSDIDLSTSHQAERIRAGIHADVRVIDVDTETECTNPNCPKWPTKKPYTVISVHHIHTLIRYTTTTPFEGSKKVFIIENSQKMTQEAAGTLLKTLEEVHSDVLIVLIAPNVESLSETVVSRCQIIELRPVESQVIESKLIEQF
ncbi:MAG: hypothetical protein NZ807_11990, partial [Dehalococcoidia bacterium]|nr:hypothetical protein [Dehalococcoidia bacterium]